MECFSLHWNILIYFSKTEKISYKTQTQLFKTTLFMHLGKAHEKKINFTFTLQTVRHTLHIVRIDLVVNINENMHPNITKTRQAQTSYHPIWLIKHSRNSCTNWMGHMLENDVIRHEACLHQTSMLAYQAHIMLFQLNQNHVLSVSENLIMFFC